MELAIFLLVYFVTVVVRIWPPKEFQEAGLYFEELFAARLGKESNNFLLYHARRTAGLMVWHSWMIFEFALLMSILFPTSYGIFGDSFDTNLYGFVLKPWILYVTVICPTVILTWVRMWQWRSGGAATLRNSHTWIAHPIFHNLTLEEQAEINAQVNELDKFCSRSKFGHSLYGGIIVTRSWIIKINMYSLQIMQQNQVAEAVVRHAEEFSVNTGRHPSDFDEDAGGAPALDDVSLGGGGRSAQYFEIEFKPATGCRTCSSSIIAKLNAAFLSGLKANLIRPLVMPDHIRVRLSLAEQFVPEFTNEVHANRPVSLRAAEVESFDLCFSCFQRKPEVKLVKRCRDDPAVQPQDACKPCTCVRPILCLSCMALMFAHVQPKRHPEVWLQGHAECPSCRSRFCVLDVAPIVTQE